MLLLDSLAIVKICESHLQLSGQTISITATLLTLIGPTLINSYQLLSDQPQSLLYFAQP